MSIMTQFYQNPCKTLNLPSQINPKFAPKSSTLSSSPSIPPTSLNLTLLSSPIAIAIAIPNPRPLTKVRAVVDDDEWGRDNDNSSNVGPKPGGVVEQPPPPVEGAENKDLKKQLVDSFYGTDRGLKASSETRAEIVELITQLEAENPTPAPTQALSLLNGKWILAYTSFSGLFPLLSRGTLPLVEVEEISQTIDSENFTVENSVQFAGPLATTSLSTNAKFEVRSPKRVQIKFVEGIIGTPQPTDSIVVPDKVEFLGQKIDLSPFKGVIDSVQDTASSVVRTISNQPPLKFNFSQDAESWLLTTYLDEELRISRGDSGSVFVFFKEGSPLTF